MELRGRRTTVHPNVCRGLVIFAFSWILEKTPVFAQAPRNCQWNLFLSDTSSGSGATRKKKLLSSWIPLWRNLFFLATLKSSLLLPRINIVFGGAVWVRNQIPTPKTPNIGRVWHCMPHTAGGLDKQCPTTFLGRLGRD